MLALFGIIFAGPFLWMVQASFQGKSELLGYPPHLLPWQPSLENYVSMLTELPTLTMFGNSVLIALVTTLMSVVFCSMGSYAFAHLRFPGRDVIYSIVMLTMMVPFYVVLVPLFLTISWMGLVNNHLAVIIPFVMNPIAAFMFRQYFIQLPHEMIEAALVDGADHMTIWWRIALPLARPMVVTAGIFMFIISWNSFIWPVVVLRTQEAWTLPVGLYSISLLARWTANWGSTLAAATLFFAPMAIAYVFLQRQFVEGMLRSGLKG
jgi:multiple sugar transport system permease protein